MGLVGAAVYLQGKWGVRLDDAVMQAVGHVSRGERGLRWSVSPVPLGHKPSASTRQPVRMDLWMPKQLPAVQLSKWYNSREQATSMGADGNEGWARPYQELTWRTPISIQTRRPAVWQGT